MFFFYFHPYLGKIPNLTNIFQRGWNHQPEKHVVPKIQGLESANGLVNLLPLCNNPLHKGIPGIQNAGPKTTNEPLADEIKKSISYKKCETPPNLAPKEDA